MATTKKSPPTTKPPAPKAAQAKELPQFQDWTPSTLEALAAALESSAQAMRGALSNPDSPDYHAAYVAAARNTLDRDDAVMDIMVRLWGPDGKLYEVEGAHKLTSFLADDMVTEALDTMLATLQEHILRPMRAKLGALLKARHDAETALLDADAMVEPSPQTDDPDPRLYRNPTPGGTLSDI